MSMPVETLREIHRLMDIQEMRETALREKRRSMNLCGNAALYIELVKMEDEVHRSVMLTKLVLRGLTAEQAAAVYGDGSL